MKTIVVTDVTNTVVFDTSTNIVEVVTPGPQGPTDLVAGTNITIASSVVSVSDNAIFDDGSF